MAAPTKLCDVKILLANREPSTHGLMRRSKRRFQIAVIAVGGELLLTPHTSMYAARRFASTWGLPLCRDRRLLVRENKQLHAGGHGTLFDRDGLRVSGSEP
jgi:hypothetical protein